MTVVLSLCFDMLGKLIRRDLETFMTFSKAPKSNSLNDYGIACAWIFGWKFRISFHAVATVTKAITAPGDVPSPAGKQCQPVQQLRMVAMGVITSSAGGQPWKLRKIAWHHLDPLGAVWCSKSWNLFPQLSSCSHMFGAIRWTGGRQYQKPVWHPLSLILIQYEWALNTKVFSAFHRPYAPRALQDYMLSSLRSACFLSKSSRCFVCLRKYKCPLHSVGLPEAFCPTISGAQNDATFAEQIHRSNLSISCHNYFKSEALIGMCSHLRQVFSFPSFHAKPLPSMVAPIQLHTQS